MKTSNPNTMAGRFGTVCAASLLPLLLLLLLPTAVQAQYTYSTNSDNSITITKYTGPGGAVTIPSTINGLTVTIIGNSAFGGINSLTSVTIPASVISIGEFAFDTCPSLANVTIGTNVTSIGQNAFLNCESLTSVTIPASLTNIGFVAFGACTNLTAITVNTNNPVYSSLAGVLFNHNQTTLITYPAGLAETSYTIPNSVTSIAAYGFYDIASLTNVVVDTSVTSIGGYGFEACVNLKGVCFLGNAPGSGSDTSVFNYDTHVTVYYLASATGFTSTFDGRPTATFSPPTAVITVVAGPSNAGTVSGGGTYAVGSSQQISASPNSGWRFTAWSDGNTQNPRTITVAAGGATYTANFAVSSCTYTLSSVIQTCKTRINIKMGTTNTTCTVAFNLVVTDTVATMASKSLVLVWLEQGSTFNATAGPAPLTKLVSALKAGKSKTIRIKTRKLSGSQTGTFIFATDADQNVLASVEVSGLK
ncbi:MAG TPA: leucine-rich repeat domain-containing protein [Verrucomicrobiae bacterium]|nr:leucine-rich repeat domain-containing protein [Verrucomicrobiae bacterium]